LHHWYCSIVSVVAFTSGFGLFMTLCKFEPQTGHTLARNCRKWFVIQEEIFFSAVWMRMGGNSFIFVIFDLLAGNVNVILLFLYQQVHLLLYQQLNQQVCLLIHQSCICVYTTKFTSASPDTVVFKPASPVVSTLASPVLVFTFLALLVPAPASSATYGLSSLSLQPAPRASSLWIQVWWQLQKALIFSSCSHL